MKEKKTQNVMRWVLNGIYLIFVLAIISGFLGPTTPPYGMRQAQKSATMETSRSIGLILFQYSVDHHGHYPEGKTSTEIFQRLLDEKYASDPNIFYIQMPGKIRPTTNQLKPENISWDITCCIDSSSPDELPLVFLTGYKVIYTAGSRAKPTQKGLKPFIAVCYKGTAACAIVADTDGSIPNFVPADFKNDGRIYRQLTP